MHPDHKKALELLHTFNLTPEEKEEIVRELDKKYNPKRVSKFFALCCGVGFKKN